MGGTTETVEISPPPLFDPGVGDPLCQAPQGALGLRDGGGQSSTVYGSTAISLATAQLL